MGYVKTKTLREKADEVIANGFEDRGNLIEAVALAIDMDARAKELRQIAAELSSKARTIGDKAATWATKSKTRCAKLFDNEPFSELTSGAMMGELLDGKTVYRLTQGAPSIVRANNANMTADFVGSLPRTWVNAVTKLVPDWSAARKAEDFAERMAEFDLEERPNYRWERAAVTASVNE